LETETAAIANADPRGIATAPVVAAMSGTQTGGEQIGFVLGAICVLEMIQVIVIQLSPQNEQGSHNRIPALPQGESP
jgi:hypothetical protein